MIIDRRREFASHEEVANRLQADFYFTHPCSSRERGTNENTKGLIRQYFAKNRDFTTITQQEIDMALEFKTPNQVFFMPGIALQTGTRGCNYPKLK